MGYLILKTNKQSEKAPELPLSDAENTNKNVDWAGLSQSELADAFFLEPDIFYEKESGLKLSRSVDLTGDGVLEGIFTGDGGNNSVSFILSKNTDGNIVALKQQDKDGSIIPISLYEIGRVMVYQNFKLLPGENGFYNVTMDYDESANNTESSHFKCTEDSVNGYMWNPQTKLFAWNQELTTKYTKELCK